MANVGVTWNVYGAAVPDGCRATESDEADGLVIETLECMGATCDPIAGPTYYGWQNGWAS